MLAACQLQTIIEVVGLARVVTERTIEKDRLIKVVRSAVQFVGVTAVPPATLAQPDDLERDRAGNLVLDPDAPTMIHFTERTASYQEAADLSVRWTQDRFPIHFSSNTRKTAASLTERITLIAER